MVGNKLISKESIKEAIFDKKFQIILEKTIHNELKDLFNLLNSLDGVNNKYMNQVATKEKNKLTNSEFEIS